jgi:hypothetical protein
MKCHFAAALLLGVAAFVAAGSAQEPALLKPINLDKLNTDKDENDPHISANGLQLYYSFKGKDKYDILVATRRSASQPWARGKLVNGFIQTDADDRSVFLTPEGRYPQFFFYATKKDQLEGANFDLYMAVKHSARADFTAPSPINAVCTAADEMDPWLTPDGRQLYFSRKTPEGWHIFVSSRGQGRGAAAFGAPKPLDLPAGFHHATLTPDGRTMYLQGPLENGRWGLFRAQRTTSGWSKPEPLTALKHPGGRIGDRAPCLSRDGRTLYFASDRPGGKGGMDLWMISVAALNSK